MPELSAASTLPKSLYTDPAYLKKLEDFRIKPTNRNLRLFNKSITNNLKISPNFNDAMRVHYLISKISKI